MNREDALRCTALDLAVRAFGAPGTTTAAFGAPVKASDIAKAAKVFHRFLVPKTKPDALSQI